MNEEIKEILRYLEECVANDNRFLIDNTNATKLSYYITNLQEENAKLKERNKILANDITKNRINCDVIQTVCGIPIEKIPYLKVYKSRNEKAVEYINKNILIGFDNAGFKTDKVAGIIVDDLLNILEGGE